MSLNPYDFQTYEDVLDITPKLPDEYDPVYILSLAAQHRTEQMKNKRRKWLSVLGSWIVALGLRIKHDVHPYMPVRHTSPRLVRVQHHRVHHSK